MVPGFGEAGEAGGATNPPFLARGEGVRAVEVVSSTVDWASSASDT